MQPIPFVEILAYLSNAKLSPTTLQHYKDRLHHLSNSLNLPIWDIIVQAEKSIKWILKHYTSQSSQKAYLSVVLAVFRYVPDMKCDLPDQHKKWFEAFTKVDKAIMERYKQNKPSEKQEAGYVPFQDIIAKRDELVKGSDERLLLAMYTYIPPMRADFNRVRIYEKRVPKDVGPNYIYYTRKGDCMLQLGEYKTSKSHGIYEKMLPVDLCKEIHASLQKRPRDFLFVTHDGRPFDKPNSYIRYANRLLAKVFHKPLTLSMLRHSFIDQLDFNQLTIAEKEAIANDMGHTTKLQDMYRLIFEKK